MNKIALTCVALCFAGLSAATYAATSADPPMPKPDKGLQGCYAPLWDTTFPTPGFWFQGLKERVGGALGETFNIHRWYEVIAAPVDEGGFGNPFDLDNVGEMVNVGCDNVPF